MRIFKKRFHQDDFIKVRDFLIETYSKDSSNWYIDRWNFCRYFAHNWLEVFKTWPDTVGMWVNEKDEIIAIVSSEGEINGQVFFQLRATDDYKCFLDSLIEYAEKTFPIQKNGHFELYPIVNNVCKEVLAEALISKGYSFTGKYEKDCSMNLTKQYLLN